MTALRMLVCMAVSGAASWPVSAGEDALALGQRYTVQLFDGRFQTIWQQMTPAMKKALGSEAALGQFMRKVEGEAGVETRVIRESVQQQPGARTYMRYSTFDKVPTPVVVSWSFATDDNPPGVMDPGNPAGNHVILDLGDGEYALLAHLQANSIVVEKGDELEAGQTIGRCGNSGNTSEPHLHFHLQNEPEFGDGYGLPAYFNDYNADGDFVARGEPVQGQTVSPGQRAAAN